jgi:hypothetical protein
MQAIVDEEVAQWRDTTLPKYPGHFIQCPLAEEQLHEYYSLERVLEESQQEGQPFHIEHTALQAFMKKPPLTKPTKKGKRPKLAPMEKGSIGTRNSVLSQFLGFCYLWLNLEPTMGLVMEPHIVAKFMGYLEAKGLAYSTMKKVRACASQHQCPNMFGMLSNIVHPCL